MKKITLAFFFLIPFFSVSLIPVQAQSGDQVIHTKEVYKAIDTFKLKVDIFYTKQTLEKENNTAIVFFHGGGWAYGTPDEFFTT